MKPTVEYELSKEKYLGYIFHHQYNVKQAWYTYLSKVCKNLPYDKDDIMNRINTHDESKITKEEFEPYRKYFYPIEGEERNENEFNKAWEHHYMNNDHHPEYWIDKDGRVQEMKLEAMLEMLCDWIAMSIQFHSNPIEWYENAIKTKEIVLHENTNLKVKMILDNPIIKNSIF